MMNRKFTLTAIPALAALLLLPERGEALTHLKQVKVADGQDVALLFDKPVKPDQIKTEYFRDIIQISIRDVGVYPAKIMSVKGGDITKVFAYQYTPKLIRTRLTVDGDAEKYRGRVKINAKGQLLSVHVSPSRGAAGPEKTDLDRVAVQSAAPDRKSPGEGAPKAPKGPKVDGKEKELLDRVMGEEDSIRLTTSKPLPSPLRAFGWLAVMLAVIGALAWFIKRGKSRGVERKLGASARRSERKGFISRLFGSALNREGRLIEVVANHQLGPKKSIAVVKVRGQTLVLGITNESINLITQIEGDLPSLEEDLAAMGISQPESRTPEAAAGATAAGPAVFSEVFNRESSAQARKPEAGTTRTSAVRDRIRQRTRGLKHL